ncbi:hypothetical protein GGR51DRAFT_535549 [Nemania sp. FL0031]|nr:hypothetical protein GGR51DRAFT_535549 [Nemania sp. FL0031]
MSGGGGFYKFRCKYFLSHDCPNWVYVNGTACAQCSALGRDLEPAASMTWYSPEVCVPRAEGGVLTYTLMEFEAAPTNNASHYSGVGHSTEGRTQSQVPTTTSALPGAPTTTTSF